MAGQKTARMTISLPRDLLEVADRLAKERASSRSSIVADLLKKEEKARIEALMEEGYREMAEEDLRFAREADPASWARRRFADLPAFGIWADRTESDDELLEELGSGWRGFG